MSKSIVSKISNFKFSIDGTEYKNVMGVMLSLFISSIPTAEIRMHSSTNKTEVLDLSESYKTLSDLMSKLYSDQVNLSLEIKPHSFKELDIPSEKLELKNWVFTGIHDYNPSSGIISITIQHPAYKLSTCGGFLNIVSSIADKFDNGESEGVENIVSAYDKALQHILKAPEDKLSISSNVTTNDGSDWIEIKQNIFQTVKGYLGEKPITKFLEWKPDVIKGGGDYKGIPLESKAGQILPGIKRAMLNDPLSLNNVDIWSSFISSCSVFSTSILPDYWKEKLPVAPVSYWAEPSIIIESDNIFNINSIIVDNDPIFGVRLIDTNYTSGELSAYLPAGEEKVEDETEFQLAYIPKDSKISPTGRFITFSAPAWWNDALKYASSSKGMSAFDSINKDPSPESGGSTNQSIEEIKGAMMCISELMFYSRYRATTYTSILTRFMVKSSNEYIAPGRVVTIKHNGTEILTGYCNQVVISIDIPDNTAFTTIGLSHIRLQKDGTRVIDDGTLNPLYT